MAKTRFILGSLILASLLAPAAAEIPVSNQASLLLRSLSYDRAIKGRARDGTAVVAVVSKSDDRASVACGSAVVAQLQRLSASGSIFSGERASVAGMPVSVVSVSSPSVDAVKARLGSEKAVAAYVCPGFPVGPLAEAARSQGVLTFSGIEADVRGGLSIGFIQRNGKSVVLVNLAASQAEKASLAASFLGVAEVIR